MNKFVYLSTKLNEQDFTNLLKLLAPYEKNLLTNRSVGYGIICKGTATGCLYKDL